MNDTKKQKKQLEDLFQNKDLKKQISTIAFGGFDNFRDYELYGDAFVYPVDRKDMSIESITKEVVQELEQAEEKFGPFNSSHEGYAVILEELDELWEVVKLNPNRIEVPPGVLQGLGPLEFDKRAELSGKWQKDYRNQMMRAEAIQVAAMAMRFIKCICDEDKE